MGQGINWHGTNFTFGPPKGMDETQVASLPVFINRDSITACWELPPTELSEVIRNNGQVFINIMGHGCPPHFVGSESAVHSMCADQGVWRMINKIYSGEQGDCLQMAEWLEAGESFNISHRNRRELIAKALRLYAVNSHG